MAVSSALTRRAMLVRTVGTLACAALARSCLSAGLDHTAASTATCPAGAASRYRISACDIMLHKRQKLGAIKLAQDIGLNGLEVDMGGLGDKPNFDNQLRKPEVRKEYFDAAAAAGIEFSSLSASAFYAQSYSDHPAADACTEDIIQTLQQMRVRVGFIPMGVKSDLSNADIRAKVIARLKRWGPEAEKAGVVLGIEAPLDAAGHKQLFDEIGSPAVQAYYNLQTGLDRGFDIYEDLRALGVERLCQIHCTDRDGKYLQDSRIDVRKLKSTLDEAGWRGWLVLERSRVSGSRKDVVKEYSTNANYLRSIMGSG